MNEQITCKSGEGGDETFTSRAAATIAETGTAAPAAHPALDMSFRQSAVFLPRQTKSVRITVVGCGGTRIGSAPRTCRAVASASRRLAS